MTFMYIWIAITATFWLAYIGLRVSPLGGYCPYTEGAKNFDREKYLGRWYEFARSDSVPKEWEVCQCQTATYVK